MAKITVKIENDHTDEILRTLNDRMAVALQAIGAECTTYAQKDCPVDTGRLRNSIAWATDKNNGGGDSSPQATPEENTVYIGSNVEYAAVQEYGDFHHTVGKKHFLRDAAATHADHYKSILKAALDS